LPLTGGPEAAESLDQHGVVGQRDLVVDDAVEQLVVARRGDVEPLPDGLFLGARVLPPLTFEIEDAARAFVELGPSGRSTV
jgi:hypothetical protein